MKNKKILVLLLIVIALAAFVIIKTQCLNPTSTGIKNQVNLVKTIKQKGLFNLSRDTKDFGIINIKNNLFYVYEVVGQGQLIMNYYSLDKGKVVNDIVLNYEWADPSLIISNDYITLVNHDTKTLAAYNHDGEILHSIYLESNFLEYESLVNFFPSIFDGKYFYVCNRFLKEPFFNIQKYDVEGYLICENLENANAWQVLQLKEELVLVDKEIVRILNKDCENVREINLKEKGWQDWRFIDGECGLKNRSNCFIYNDMFFGICDKPILYVTDLQEYYETYDLYELLNIKKERTIDVKDEIRIFGDKDYFYIIDLPEETVYKFDTI